MAEPIMSASGDPFVDEEAGDEESSEEEEEEVMSPPVVNDDNDEEEGDTEMVNFITPEYQDDPDVVEHDQLPSLEQVKTSHRIAQDHQQGRATGTSQVWDRTTTCALTGVLVSMLLVFFLTFFMVPLLQGDDGDDDVMDNINTINVDAPPPNTIQHYHPIEQALRDNIALQQGQEFVNVNSYQSKSLAFLLSQANVYELYSTARLRQVYALACLYFATNNHHNNEQSSWRSYYTQSSQDAWVQATEECDWPGVTCTHQQVTRLDLALAGMQGSLPLELQLLQSSLTELLLDDNPGLTGSIPDFLGYMELAYLTLTDCGFTGSMPGSICNYHQSNSAFNFLIDCDKIFCQPTCCEDCRRRL